ncbi:acyltransferase family protein [Luteimicrobium subarcticum]|uniref:Peptidoglycan/LPS O-acetylase OafA/YrhL n=1 Tax=Luteimicrobium subarcticum TaxID=620910 RepID=A0A2M8WV60_9MICO|nr:acyltransferase family protein [Luteimicrobium subarcticum]PJI94815.1 peptidoglycan/LPS O-acetylase OafA/YrhL [Luteimicrobium subarcticum]
MPGLDGLRAVAVIAVIVYHVQPTWLPGGFLGVDVFFAVSGFLITTLLLRELQTRHRLNLPAFWMRRVRRLVPALVVVVVTSIVAARLVEPDLLVHIGRQTFGAATFTSNWVEVVAGSSYFDQTSPLIFQTFWSLAIEEQFYLVWPVVLAVLIALVRGGRACTAVVLAAALGSAVLMAALYSPGADPTRVYYGTDTHVFGLLIGVAAALWWGSGRELLPRAVASWVPALALVALVVEMRFLRTDMTFAYRGGILLGSALAMLAVAGCTGRAGGYLRLLGWSPLTWVGVRSYGLYLWHWPVLLVVWGAFDAFPGTSTWWLATAIGVAVTLLVAAASYRWVETPIRRDGFRAVWHRATGAVRRPGARLAPVAVAGVVGLVVVAGCAVATAPAETSAQRSVEAGMAAIDTTGVETDGVDPATAPTPHPTPDPTASPTTGGRASRGNAQKSPSSDPSRIPTAPGTGAGDDAASPLVVHGAVDGKQVIGFGDSVMSGAAPALLQAFPGIALDAVPIRKWVDAPAIVQKAADAGKLRPYVVLNFGTNGGFQFAGSDKALEKVLAILGPDRKVVLVNTVGVSYWVPDANKELAKIAGRYPNVVVADWCSAAKSEPGLLHPDRTHPNMKGIPVYAGVVEDALKTVSGR